MTSEGDRKPRVASLRATRAPWRERVLWTSEGDRKPRVASLRATRAPWRERVLWTSEGDRKPRVASLRATRAPWRERVLWTSEGDRKPHDASLRATRAPWPERFQWTSEGDQKPRVPWTSTSRFALRTSHGGTAVAPRARSAVGVGPRDCRTTVDARADGKRYVRTRTRLPRHNRGSAPTAPRARARPRAPCSARSRTTRTRSRPPGIGLAVAEVAIARGAEVVLTARAGTPGKPRAVNPRSSAKPRGGHARSWTLRTRRVPRCRRARDRNTFAIYHPQ